MGEILIGKTAKREQVSLKLKYGNRHGLVTGATGTGKTVTLQTLAEGFSRAGVPVFAADIKGDLSGIAKAGEREGKASERAKKIGVSRQPEAFPVRFWDVAKKHGLPVCTSVVRVGQLLMSRMLHCNQTQDGTLSIAFKSREDMGAPIFDLGDLQQHLNEMRNERASYCEAYGNVTAASIAAIQREILTLGIQGGENLFGEPGLDILDLMQVAPDGKGVISLLHADDLMQAPRLYASMLMWLLTELFRVLPEAGDLEKPKMVFFFDEAHLLFRGAPDSLLEAIERVVRLIRSKGVGVYFVTQSPADIPDPVLAQLGNRIQHALRAYTPADQRMVRAASRAFRSNKGVDVLDKIANMGVGEALVSCLGEGGIPAPVEHVFVVAPSAQIGPITLEERAEILDADPLKPKYAAEGTETAQYHAFQTRIAMERGLPPPPPPMSEEESAQALERSLSILSQEDRRGFFEDPVLRFFVKGSAIFIPAAIFANWMGW
jgi:uncharacterized protein